MKFILCRVHAPEWDFLGPWLQLYRATYVSRKRSIDMFFFASDPQAAKAQVVAKYPKATFTDNKKGAAP